MDVDVGKRRLAGESAGHHRHPGHPEKDDVKAGDQHTGGVPALEISSLLLRPTQSGEGPQTAGEPRVQRILVLLNLGLGAELGAGLLQRLGFIAGHHIGGGVGVAPAAFADHKPGGDAMAPPQLTADAPIADIGKPVAIDLAPALRHKLRLGLLKGFTAAGGQRLRLHKPLGGEQWFDGHLAAIGVGNAVAVRLHLDQAALLLHGRHYSLTGLKAIKPSKHSGLLVHRAVLGHHRDQRQAVALTNGEIIGVMGGRHLDAAGAELSVDMLIGHDRDLTAHQRQGEGLTHQGLVARIGRIDRHTGVSEQRLRAGGGHLEMAAAIAEGVTEMPEMAIHLLHLHLQITDR